MSKFVCKFCGRKTAYPSGGSCSHSPHKKHEYIEASSSYMCRYCGRKTPYPSGGSCSHSPHKKHEYIAI